MTVAMLLEQTAARFDAAGLAYGHGTLNAWDEAAWLILHALGQPLDGLDAVRDTPLTTAQLAAIEALLAQRITSRQPAAYLTHEAWLVGLPFYVDARSIIPRSFIAELLANSVLDAWMPPAPTRMLDLCTGNGSLAVISALAYPEVTVDAADISPDALAVARINVSKHSLDERITLIQSDLYAKVTEQYDCILSNPPYVNEQSMQALPEEYQAEPRLALAGGSDGMDLVRRILLGARARLKPGGFLVVEIGNEYDHLLAAFPDLALTWLSVSAGDEQVFLIEYDDLP